MIELRRAIVEDCRLIWEWANDPTVRRASFSQTTIPWQHHTKWFSQKLGDPGCHLFVVMDGDRPIGQVRFEVARDEAEVHISIAAPDRGHGQGAAALRVGAARIKRDAGVARIVAHIKSGNAASIRVFESAGFVQAGTVDVQGVNTERMVLPIER